MRSLSTVAVFLACFSLGCAKRAGTPIEEGSVLVARDEGGGTVTLRVDGVMRDPKDADGDLFLYELFEAAWSPRGAVYLHKPRFGETLESLVAECPDRLRGRTPLDAPELDAEAAAARWPEALMFTDSRAQTEMP